MKASRKLFLLTPLCALLAVGSAHATNGYFPHGFGVKAMGMGGASVAMTDNAFAGTNNPAIAAWAGNRIEGGLTFFSPKRSMSRTGSVAGLDTAVESGSNLFYVPEFGYNRALSDKMGVGITVYGNGGMNTEYPGGQTNCTAFGNPAGNPLCGVGGLGVDLMQLIVAPTLAYKLNDMHSVGISPLLVFQQFEAHGLQGFTLLSSDASKLTSGSYSHSTGFGVRLGYLGKLNDKFSVGASYSPKINMSEFDEYAGLFAGGGGFDIPENYTLGMSFQATPTVTVALDYSRINYSGVPSIANPSTNPPPLGAANGPGFGWQDINVWKLGVQWQASSQWTLRAGLNVGDNPIQSRDVTFNILAPGVITKHVTLGGTYAMSPTTEVSFSYMYAPEESVTGSSFFNNFGPGVGGTETIKMSQQSIGIQFGWHWK
ncbi:OmpP1/FadL family transporter [Rhodoferax sp.]|uniref:OmpP1/FadL family transporter n=1 Tax=Rhodoferax sp. TaxID=50421 RepID=UPI0027306069|nr:outer membrane protein transport protein [Rhodoferax sp.]MDP1531101.1 outer membrane protein transport protein [Rhodoferax sp.]MDP1945118.1 outer membrane protein transport protein [Rhodoferax sp.]MDP2442278.1 outer membrane protein transport protein [Rhodoferax sp.]MDZ4206921.1 outer membrane protein transport protein [Rhodoferax sp.]